MYNHNLYEPSIIKTCILPYVNSYQRIVWILSKFDVYWDIHDVEEIPNSDKVYIYIGIIPEEYDFMPSIFKFSTLIEFDDDSGEYTVRVEYDTYLNCLENVLIDITDKLNDMYSETGVGNFDYIPFSHEIASIFDIINENKYQNGGIMILDESLVVDVNNIVEMMRKYDFLKDATIDYDLHWINDYYELIFTIIL